LRVSHIAEMAWCQVKAQAVLQNKIRLIETDKMAEGLKYHKKLGYDQGYHFKKRVDNIIVEGTVDRLEEKRVIELKCFWEEYPIRFLIAPAHIQANLYAFLCNKKEYGLAVYFVNRNFLDVRFYQADYNRAVSDVFKARDLLYERVEPIPTNYRFKCYSCELKERCRYAFSRIRHRNISR